VKRIIDTTLRDGEQLPGLCLSSADKVKIAALLDEAGVYQIEAGAPAMDGEEKHTICQIMQNRKNSKIATWNRLRKSDLRHSLDCQPDVVHISAPVSAQHIFGKLNKDRNWLRETLKDCVYFVKERGFEVMVGFEDASRADLKFMLEIINMLTDLDVALGRLADTVGILTPAKAEAATRAVCRQGAVAVGIHAHNDLGMAVANSLTAAKAGAAYIDTTLFGIGERAGNCDLRAFVRLAGRAWRLKPAPEDVDDLEKEAFPLIFKHRPALTN
jgi:homocitrate synthase NifV